MTEQSPESVAVIPPPTKPPKRKEKKYTVVKRADLDTYYPEDHAAIQSLVDGYNAFMSHFKGVDDEVAPLVEDVPKWLLSTIQLRRAGDTLYMQIAYKTAKDTPNEEETGEEPNDN